MGLLGSDDGGYMDEVEEPQQPQPPSLLDHLAGAGEPQYDADPTAAHEPVEPEPVEYEAVEYEPVEYDPGATTQHEAVDPRYEAAGYEVDAGGEAEHEAEAEAEDGEDAKKRRVPLSTKFLLVGAGWVLLTFFFIGVFNKDSKKDDSVRLSQAPGAATLDEAAGEDDDDAAGGSDESGGDGVTDGDADATVDSYAVEKGTGGTSGSNETGTTTAGGTGGTSSGGGSSGGSTATTARSGGGGTGGSSTSTTATPGGGGGGGGGGGPTSTTATTQPPGSNTTATTAPAQSVTIRTTDFSRNAVTISRGQTVEFYNSTLVGHTLKIEDQPGTVEVDPGERVSVLFSSKGKFRVESENSGHVGHCDVTVN